MPEFAGVLERRNQEETFDVELQSGVQYIVDLAGTSSPSGRIDDPYIEVFVGLDYILYDDDSGPSAQSQLIITPSVTETYSFDVNGYDTGGFVLRVFEDDLRNHPEGIAPAGSPGSGGESDGGIDYDGDVDIHEVALIEGLTYEIQALGSDSGSGSLADPELRLRDFGGLTIAADNADSGAGADDLIEFTPEFSGVYYVDVRGFETETGSYRTAVSEGLGTEAADEIVGTASADAVNALGGADRVSGGRGGDTLMGAGGADELLGRRGHDVLDGQADDDTLVGGLGDDLLEGGSGADSMRGGGGADVFVFTEVGDSTAQERDELLPGRLGVALGRPGAEVGDVIDLTEIDADAEQAGDQAFVFGASETIAGLWLVEEGDVTVVRASVDDDAEAEFELAILDGGVGMADYTSDDFAL